VLAEDFGPPPDYGNAEYWETYYAAQAGQMDRIYDWIADWAEVAPLVEGLLAQADGSQPVLHLGCGNSELPEEMHDAGYTRQTCVDVSPAVVARMAARNAGRPGLRWLAADATDLETVLPSDEFALVVDKSTLDALLCNEQYAPVIAKFLHEAFRVTAPGGVYVSISFNEPDRMLRLLRHRAFNWQVRALPLLDRKQKESGSFMYICVKNQPTEESVAQWPLLLERAFAAPTIDPCSEDEA